MAYKSVRRETTLSAAVGDGFSALEELADEMRSWFDNLSEGLQQTEKGQTVESTASSLESVYEPTVPDCVAELKVVYHEFVNADKRRGPSRAVRCDNAVRMLEEARDALDEHLREISVTAPAMAELVDGSIAQLVTDLDEMICNADGLDFPGMY